MNNIAVIDTETTWGDEVMSIGVVIADAKDYKQVESRYYVFDPEYRDGGFYSSELFRMPKKDTIITDRKTALDEIDTWLKKAGIKKIFAYNASFDKNHIPEFSGYMKKRTFL
ncbi:MAG: hypothetical protein K5697_08225 [Lachnospiraceae bacterium]|nr:hypothetical protein [Lachnospiraceae bacterium]